jgi:hypothetical protein
MEGRRFEGRGAWSVRGFGGWDDDGGLRMPRNRSERGQGEGLMGEWPDDPGTGGWIARNEKPRMGVRGGRPSGFQPLTTRQRTSTRLAH